MGTFKSEINEITREYVTKQISKARFLERLMCTGGQPRQINKFLPKQYRQLFTDHYNQCDRDWKEINSLMGYGW